MDIAKIKRTLQSKWSLITLASFAAIFILRRYKRSNTQRQACIEKIRKRRKEREENLKLIQSKFVATDV
jgi:hypothetical protein